MRGGDRARLRSAVLASALLAAVPALAAPPKPSVGMVTRAVIPLPGAPSRFDYQSFDPALGRLFISHMGDGTVVVFDTRNERVLANLPGFPDDTGITAVPDTGRVYVSVTGSLLHRALGGGEIAVLDAATLKLLARIPAGTFPDGSAYVAQLHRLYVSDESGGREIVIDTIENRRIANIPLGGSAGMTAFDPVSGDIFVNVQSRRELAEIRPGTDKIIARIALPRTCTHNHGLLLFPPERLAFIGCDGSARLLVLDLRSGKPVSTNRVGQEPDVLALDPVRDRLYVASESGVVAVFAITAGDVRKLWQGVVGENAHTVSVDPRTGLIYFPIRNLKGHPVLKVIFPVMTRPAN